MPSLLLVSQNERFGQKWAKSAPRNKEIGLIAYSTNFFDFLIAPNHLFYQWDHDVFQMEAQIVALSH